MSPLLDLFLQPEHLARLSIRRDGHLRYNCGGLSCGSCPMYTYPGKACLAVDSNFAPLEPIILDLHPELFL